jgi:hypothetical protein
VRAGALLAAALVPCAVVARAAEPIDRRALVARHHPVLRALDVDAPLTVGNGGFAFGADITGLQTFAHLYHREGIPAETLARWAWHTEDNPHGYALRDADRPYRQADGRTVAYPTDASSPAGDWLRRNPHIHPLGQLSLDFTRKGGAPLAPEDLQRPEQTLDLWRGVITSRYALGGVPVTVTTACHPSLDLLAIRIESAHVASGRLGVRLAFPRRHDPAVKNTPALDWSAPESHTSRRAGGGRIARTIGATRYDVTVDGAVVVETGRHVFRLTARPGASVLELAVGFFRPGGTPARRPGVAEIFRASAAGWEAFWREGAAVDFSGSTDPRAAAVERRIVLSRYLTAVQLAGEVPPQESGLTCSTWYGKHHTEMIWWHTAHFALWGQDALLAKNLEWYAARLPEARALARQRGLKGARWAKMVGPDGRESPGGNPLIVWNQPHVIALAELLYRNRPGRGVLDRYRDLVLETADGLASMVHFDRGQDRYVLGPPLWIAQEIYDPATSQNPSFELAYWRYALGVAQEWRVRLGLPRSPGWDHVLAHLAPLPVKDGRYVALGSHPDTFETVDSRHDHPTMLAPLGLLPGDGVDRATMERTLDAVLATWDWETKIWGWDYPMIAMTAARLGRPETAVEVLMREGPNNRYTPSGHCPQRSDVAAPKGGPPGRPRREIAAYLPANGAFLSAVALMVAGWDGSATPFPGFPKDGRWTIRAEGVRALP